MEISEAGRLKEEEPENPRLKRLLAEKLLEPVDLRTPLASVTLFGRLEVTKWGRAEL